MGGGGGGEGSGGVNGMKSDINSSRRLIATESVSAGAPREDMKMRAVSLLAWMNEDDVPR